MVLQFLLWLLLAIYIAASVVLMIYGLNTYLLLFLFGRRVRTKRTQQRELKRTFLAEAEKKGDEAWPIVTTQIPLYNERNVAERVIRAVAAFDYPTGRHQIQVVDDSNDETCELVDQIVAELKGKGIWIDACRREDRVGYKAGGLKEAMDDAEGEFIAIFDSDFVPEPDFLKETIPLFPDEKTGLVQARWGHLNSETSMLTRAQSVGIDGHFVVEQVARSANRLFLNFNGTAGVWRRAAIDDGGGWQADTLTEDLDLSYRCQLRGWKLEFAIDVVVPAELPETYSAFLGQQFRWAKGSVQTAKKLLKKVFVSDVPALAKMQAVFHLLHYCAHLFMLIHAFVPLPLSFLLPEFNGLLVASFFIVPLIMATLGPSVLYSVSQYYLYPRDWWKKLIYLPGMVALGFGICISNSRAVYEAIVGKRSGFVRTPKTGTSTVKKYKTERNWLPYIQLGASLYCALTVFSYAWRGSWGALFFFMVYGVGFLTVGIATLREQNG